MNQDARKEQQRCRESGQPNQRRRPLRIRQVKLSGKGKKNQERREQQTIMKSDRNAEDASQLDNGLA